MRARITGAGPMLPVLFLLLLAAGCGRNRDPVADRAAESRASAAESAATLTTGEGVVLPSLGETLPVGEELAHAFEAQSAELDRRCASLPMSASFSDRRPAGTGCPRFDTDAQAEVSP